MLRSIRIDNLNSWPSQASEPRLFEQIGAAEGALSNKKPKNGLDYLSYETKKANTIHGSLKAKHIDRGLCLPPHLFQEITTCPSAVSSVAS